MSMRNYSCYGYGFSIENASNIDLIKEIVKGSFSAEDVEEMKEAIDMSQNVGELIANIEYEMHLVDESISMLVAEWMNSNKELNPDGIRFSGFGSQYDCGTEESVLFTEGFPWQFTEAELKLKATDVEHLTAKFAKLLGIPDIDVNYQTLEYYG